MTAEEKARKYLENKYSELDHTANYDSEGGEELYINEIDVSKLMADYLNSQRDTIFKEELEKRLPSGGELKAQVIQETIDCNNRSNSEYYAEDYCEGFGEGIKWLIQYLKK